MKAFRAHEVAHPGGACARRPHLRAVSPGVAPTPRWRSLYLMLGGVGVIAAALHAALADPAMFRTIDTALAAAVIAILAGWVHDNRVALTWMSEPDRSAAPPQARIVRSRRRVADARDARPSRPGDGHRVIVPLDVK